jgi:hypothetical protein
MKLIPIQDTFNQTFASNIGGQQCQLSIYQKTTGLYLDISINNSLLIGGILCRNFNRLIRDPYWGFAGDLMFWDIQGTSDPYSPGLGTRFRLYYVEPSDLVGIQFL